MKRVQVTYQNEITECGLASLVMILNHHGKNVDLIYLREKIKSRDLGVNLDKLVEVAESEGLDARPIKVDLEDLVHVKKPALLHWNMDHYVVLEKTSRNKYYILDPAIGRRILEYRDLFAPSIVSLVWLSNSPRESSFKLETSKHHYL